MNLPTSHVVAPADPNVEGTNSGVNAASNYNGIGIAQAVPNPKADDWPRVADLDVQSGPIGWGGDNTTSGQTTPLSQLEVNYADGDFNDSVVFDVANQAAQNANDIYNTSNNSRLSVTLDQAIGSGDWIWGRTNNA